MRIADFVGGVVVLLLGMGIFFFSRELPYGSEFGPGPAFLPCWIGIGLMGCAIVVLVNLLRKQKTLRTFFHPRTRDAAKMLILIIFTFLFLSLLGFSIGFALFSVVSMRVMGKHRWIICGLTAVGVAIGIHFVFGDWLSIPLPTGILGW